MQIVDNLIAKGVWIPNPASVEIGPEVDPTKISDDGVVIHSGCKIYGNDTFIAAGVTLGAEAPVAIENCQIGPDVELKGGFFKKAVFLEGASCGLGSHVREGTIMEEQSSIAHTVGLKQTILFPFVTLGSLINFCDCFMAGGTSRSNHSEVGSSYIHFNFTPNQDKATASLIGDVPGGVMLNQKPIFLGGQGGIIGPCRLTYGLTAAAGTILRKDELRPDRLLFGGGYKYGSMEFTPGKFTGTKRVLENNLIYMANLLALEHWYLEVRRQFIGRRFPEALLNGLCTNVRAGLNERLARLEVFCRHLADSRAGATIDDWWSEMAALYTIKSTPPGDQRLKESFLEGLGVAIAGTGRNYLQAIKSLDRKTSAAGTGWLQSIVDACFQDSCAQIPFINPQFAESGN